MYTIIVCKEWGYSVEKFSEYGRASARFLTVTDDDSTTVAAFYHHDGTQLNAFHKPEAFKS